jgi:hypothetical protein
LLIPQNPKHVLISLKNSRKERITVGINLNLNPGDIRFIALRIDLEIDQFITTEMLNIAFIVDVFHLCWGFMIEKKSVALFYSWIFYGRGVGKYAGLKEWVRHWVVINEF